ncbi:MAG: hydroxypyruvate isomerase family protein [Acidimicrobiia bacterium]
MLWADRPPLDRFDAAAAAGFTHVEMLFPQTLPGEQLKEKLQSKGLQMALFDFYAGDWEAGERGLAALPDRIEEFRTHWTTDLELASRLGTRTMTVLAGIRPLGADPLALDQILIDNLRALAELAVPMGITLALEAINNTDVPGFHVRTVGHAATVVEAVGMGNVGIQLDQYHVAREYEDPIAHLEAHLERIAHVQIADSPGRHEPGTGTAPIKRFLDRLDELGYQGRVGLEYVPSGDTDASLSWLSRAARRP